MMGSTVNCPRLNDAFPTGGRLKTRLSSVKSGLLPKSLFNPVLTID